MTPPVSETPAPTVPPGLDLDVVVHRGPFTLRTALQAAAGDVVAVLGANGAGKTTLLHTLAGLLRCDEGRVALDGRVLDDPGEGVFVAPEHRSVGLVFQEPRLFGRLDVLENVAFGMRARGVARDEAGTEAMAWLERLAVADLAHRRADQLSGGQARRVALARALVTEPQLLLLDEPGTSLDVDARALVVDELAEHLAAYDGVALVVTHDPDDATRLTTRTHTLLPSRPIPSPPSRNCEG